MSSTGKILSNCKTTFPISHNPNSVISAKDFHVHNLPVMVEQALAGAQISDMTKLEAVAVAMGPGSHVCLRVGIDFAQAIGAKFDIPVIPVNHIEAHLMTARMEAVANLEEGAEF